MRMLLFMVGFILVGVGSATANDSDTFDPLLDDAPGEGPSHRYNRPSGPGTGFTISGHGGIYGGSVKSYLTDQLSTLLEGVRPNVGFGFGARLDSPLELGVNIDLGFGKTFEAQTGGETPSIDLLIEPRLLAHWYESWPAGAYAGLGALAVLFDIEESGVSQFGLGPCVLLGVLRRTGPHSLFFAEVGATYFYDTLAYEVTTTPAIRSDGSVDQVTDKDEGAWFTIFRVTIGYRLTAF
jgi:hypothetical protein